MLGLFFFTSFFFTVGEIQLGTVTALNTEEIFNAEERIKNFLLLFTTHYDSKHIIQAIKNSQSVLTNNEPNNFFSYYLSTMNQSSIDNIASNFSRINKSTQYIQLLSYICLILSTKTEIEKNKKLRTCAEYLVKNFHYDNNDDNLSSFFPADFMSNLNAQLEDLKSKERAKKLSFFISCLIFYLIFHNSTIVTAIMLSPFVYFIASYILIL